MKNKTFKVILKAFCSELALKSKIIEVDTKRNKKKIVIGFYKPREPSEIDYNGGSIQRQEILMPDNYGVFKYFGDKNKDGIKIYELTELKKC